ncbi:unnamed protein product [Closterium sp. Naga37s-1]|nr:unnamed protein product [Closterium sp. Naga37s-1]
MPQGEHIELHQKRHGFRLDHFERKRKREARQVHKTSQIARNTIGLKAKMFAKKRYQEKATMKKTLAMHAERTNKHKADAPVAEGAVPAYLLEREATARAKVLSNTIKQKRKEKAGKWDVPLPKVRPIAEDEMFKVVRSGKRKTKQWKRLVTKVTFVGPGFTRKPPKYERFIRPMALRFTKAHVTHPELKCTFHLDIISVKKNPNGPMYSSMGVITKGTIIEVNVSELGLVTPAGKVIWVRRSKVWFPPKRALAACQSFRTTRHADSSVRHHEQPANQALMLDRLGDDPLAAASGQVVVGSDRRYRVVYRLVNSIYVLGLMLADDDETSLNVYSCISTVNQAVSVLVAACKGVDVTPEKIFRKYTEVYMAFFYVLQGIGAARLSAVLSYVAGDGAALLVPLATNTLADGENRARGAASWRVANAEAVERLASVEGACGHEGENRPHGAASWRMANAEAVERLASVEVMGGGGGEWRTGCQRRRQGNRGFRPAALPARMHLSQPTHPLKSPMVCPLPSPIRASPPRSFLPPQYMSSAHFELPEEAIAAGDETMEAFAPAPSQPAFEAPPAPPTPSPRPSAASDPLAALALLGSADDPFAASDSLLGGGGGELALLDVGGGGAGGVGDVAAAGGAGKRPENDPASLLAELEAGLSSAPPPSALDPFASDSMADAFGADLEAEGLGGLAALGDDEGDDAWGTAFGGSALLGGDGDAWGGGLDAAEFGVEQGEEDAFGLGGGGDLGVALGGGEGVAGGSAVAAARQLEVALGLGAMDVSTPTAVTPPAAAASATPAGPAQPTFRVEERISADFLGSSLTRVRLSGTVFLTLPLPKGGVGAEGAMGGGGGAIGGVAARGAGVGGAEKDARVPDEFSFRLEGSGAIKPLPLLSSPTACTCSPCHPSTRPSAFFFPIASLSSPSHLPTNTPPLPLPSSPTLPLPLSPQRCTMRPGIVSDLGKGYFHFRMPPPGTIFPPLSAPSAVAASPQAPPMADLLGEGDEGMGAVVNPGEGDAWGREGEGAVGAEGRAQEFVLMKYRLQPRYTPIPLRLRFVTRRSDEALSLMIQYVANPYLQAPLLNVTFILSLAFSPASLRLNPEAQLDPWTKELRWHVPQITSNDPPQRLRAQIPVIPDDLVHGAAERTAEEKQAEEDRKAKEMAAYRVRVEFECRGSSLSGVTVGEVMASGKPPFAVAAHSFSSSEYICS